MIEPQPFDQSRNETVKTRAEDWVNQGARDSQIAREAFLTAHSTHLVQAAQVIGAAFKAGGKLLIMGNGGSAADAQHMAAEFTGRLLVERRPLPALALTTDSSALTAIGNDYGYDQVFLRQAQALARPGDVALAISTSGNSRNVVRAVEHLRAIHCPVITLTGGKGGELARMGQVNLCVSEGFNSSRIQETHIFAIHMMVDLVDQFFL